MAELERRIKAIEARNSSGEPRDLPDAPAGVPDSYSEHIKLMFDLQVLAMESDMTRIIAFKTGRDAQNRVFPESGSNQPFHPSSHHGNREDRIMEFNKICKYRVSQLDYFLDQDEADDGRRSEPARQVGGALRVADGGREHPQPSPLPAGRLRPRQRSQGQHAPQGADATPMANVFLTLMHNMGSTICSRSATARASSRSPRRRRRRRSCLNGAAGHDARRPGLQVRKCNRAGCGHDDRSCGRVCQRAGRRRRQAR